MGCCRGRSLKLPRQPAECEKIERAGASYILWPKVTNTGIVLAIKTDAQGFLPLSSFLSVFGCTGPVTSLLARNVSSLENISPGILNKYTKTGISIGQALQLSKK